MCNNMFILPVFLLTLSSQTLQASVIHVPADSATIQGGINGAVDGDTVIVADGTYMGNGNRDIDFLGKAIVVMSENGPGVTIIDCEGSPSDPHRGFSFTSGEDSRSVIQGFTIRNGYVLSDNGGGVYCFNSSPTITGNEISRNSGGIHCEGGSPTIKNNLIVSSLVHNGIRCLFSFSPATIKNNTIVGNAVNGISLDETGGIVVIGNTIMGNEVYGLSLDKVSGTIVDGNTITGNAYDGINCTFSYPTFVKNTISGNAGSGIGGSGYCGTVRDCILWNDSPNEIHWEMSVGVTYSDVEGGWLGEGNIDADPMFVLPEKGDYRLLWGSPCIDSGQPDSFDTDGTRRDMGAHFFDQDDYMTLYLTPDTNKVLQGGQLGVTYTVINRWLQPETFWGLTQAILPDGSPDNIIGPDQYLIPPNTTIQPHFDHSIPASAPVGRYEYWSRIGLPPSTLYGEDRFTFEVVK